MSVVMVQRSITSLKYTLLDGRLGFDLLQVEAISDMMRATLEFYQLGHKHHCQFHPRTDEQGIKVSFLVGTVVCGRRPRQVADLVRDGLNDLIPVAPMPTTPTRLPAKSTGSFGQRAVWNNCPLNDGRYCYARNDHGRFQGRRTDHAGDRGPGCRSRARPSNVAADGVRVRIVKER